MSLVPSSKDIGGGLGVHEGHEGNALVAAGAEETGQVHILDLTVPRKVIPDVVGGDALRDLGNEQPTGLVIHLPWGRPGRAAALAVRRRRGVGGHGALVRGEHGRRRHVPALAGTLLLAWHRPVDSNLLSGNVVDWGSQHLLTLTSIHESDEGNPLVPDAARHPGHVAVAELAKSPEIRPDGVLLQGRRDLGHEHADAGRRAALPRHGERGGLVGGRRAHGRVGRSIAGHEGVAALALATLLSPGGCAVDGHLLSSDEVDLLQQNLLPGVVVCIGNEPDPLVPCLPRDARHVAVSELAESPEIRAEVVLVQVLGDLGDEDAESFGGHDDGCVVCCLCAVPSF
mmetsp:Transcript_5593/g.13298  ORF Transcript_5593/g.13298 Transcript_5593/m.13298 type:complete len:342 (+) Transcript_5593:364-1389(+)